MINTLVGSSFTPFMNTCKFNPKKLMDVNEKHHSKGKTHIIDTFTIDLYLCGILQQDPSA
jgi:hypothetical protein